MVAIGDQKGKGEMASKTSLTISDVIAVMKRSKLVRAVVSEFARVNPNDVTLRDQAWREVEYWVCGYDTEVDAETVLRAFGAYYPTTSRG